MLYAERIVTTQIYAFSEYVINLYLILLNIH